MARVPYVEKKGQRIRKSGNSSKGSKHNSECAVCRTSPRHWPTARARARELCRLLGDPPQLFPVLFGLNGFHTLRGELNTARELSSQLLAVAQARQDTALLLNAHFAVGLVLYNQGEFLARARISNVSARSTSRLCTDQPWFTVAMTRGSILSVFKASFCGGLAIPTRLLTGFRRR
jgi:hypothetical protein